LPLLLAPTAATTAAAPDGTSLQTGGLSTGARAGIGLGAGIAVLALVFSLGWWCVSWRRRRGRLNLAGRSPRLRRCQRTSVRQGSSSSPPVKRPRQPGDNPVGHAGSWMERTLWPRQSYLQTQRQPTNPPPRASARKNRPWEMEGDSAAEAAHGDANGLG